MLILRWIKRFSALLLVSCFFLPLSQCTQKEVALDKPVKTVDISAYSAYEWPSIGSSLATVLFFWPAVAQLVALRSRKLETRRSFLAMELMLISLTFAGISWLVLWGSVIRYGAYIAYAAAVAYALASIFLFTLTRRLTGLGQKAARFSWQVF